MSDSVAALTMLSLGRARSRLIHDFRSWWLGVSRAFRYHVYSPAGEAGVRLFGLDNIQFYISNIHFVNKKDKGEI